MNMTRSSQAARAGGVPSGTTFHLSIGPRHPSARSGTAVRRRNAAAQTPGTAKEPRSSPHRVRNIAGSAPCKPMPQLPRPAIPSGDQATPKRRIRAHRPPPAIPGELLCRPATPPGLSSVVVRPAQAQVRESRFDIRKGARNGAEQRGSRACCDTAPTPEEETRGFPAREPIRLAEMNVIGDTCDDVAEG